MKKKIKQNLFLVAHDGDTNIQIFFCTKIEKVPFPEYSDVINFLVQRFYSFVMFVFCHTWWVLHVGPIDDLRQTVYMYIPLLD